MCKNAHYCGNFHEKIIGEKINEEIKKISQFERWGDNVWSTVCIGKSY